MEDLIATFFNIAFYIFIFKLISGAFPGKKKKDPEKETPAVIIEKRKKTKKKKTFLEEALEQIKKLEELSQEPVKKKKKLRPIQEIVSSENEIKPEPITKINKVIDEKKEEIYYNNDGSDYQLDRKSLKKAIVYSEIIGKPVSKRIGMPYRR